ncbi:DUF3048 domain-containing protein [Patescibacteria group bacterium]|nr:DUF3048 domain-containing protein [Patescibacteria group bacterium]MCL5010113.1 DUF3048 domain-containing protein [Patescibacteria group bacterium]
MDKKKIIVIFLGIVLYLVSAGISYRLFSKSQAQQKTSVASPLSVSSAKTLSDRLVFPQGAPKTEQCPLNGVFYSKDQANWWAAHRPLGVMIENQSEARPQSGLSFADVIYEAVAEGGITRFLAVFYCQDAGIIGPIRSARTYFLDFISEYGSHPLYTHVGGANAPGPADALSQITEYGWTGYNDLNQFSIGFPTFWRDYTRQGHTVATEHTMYSTTTKLWDFAAKSRGLTNVDKNGSSWDSNFVEYSFKNDDPLAERGNIQKIHIEFWPHYEHYAVDWIYDRALNIYKREDGGVPQIDRDTNQQLSAKNIVVLFMKESHANDGYMNNEHLLYNTKGMGDALVFRDGKKITADWKKAGRTARTLLFDTNGSPVKFDRGKIWFEILPTYGIVNAR